MWSILKGYSLLNSNESMRGGSWSGYSPMSKGRLFGRNLNVSIDLSNGWIKGGDGYLSMIWGGLYNINMFSFNEWNTL